MVEFVIQMLWLDLQSCALDMYSDAHKDAYGFRPRGAAMQRVRALSPGEIYAEVRALDATWQT